MPVQQSLGQHAVKAIRKNSALRVTDGTHAFTEQQPVVLAVRILVTEAYETRV